jgi:hypothetical protein
VSARSTAGLVAAVAVTLAAGVWAADCKQTTELIVRVRATSCQDVLSTTITVGTLESVEKRLPSASRSGCDPTTGEVGSLVLVPSAGDDDEVHVRVVTGVGVSAESCVAPAFAGCVVEKRTLRYEAGRSVIVEIPIDPRCRDVRCAPGEQCIAGRCASEDGGVVSDAGVGDGSLTDAGADVDAAVVPVKCEDVCDAGTCVAGRCEIACTAATCDAGATCPAGVPCKVTCMANDSCPGTIKCVGATSCEVICEGDRTCAKVECDTPGACNVECNGNASCGTGVTCRGASCDLTCDRNESCPGAFTCNATGRCKADCDGDRACEGLVVCQAGTCDIQCKRNGTCKGGVRADAGATTVRCAGDRMTCAGNVQCVGGSCTASCMGMACGADFCCDAGTCDAGGLRVACP